MGTTPIPSRCPRLGVPAPLLVASLWVWGWRALSRFAQEPVGCELRLGGLKNPLVWSSSGASGRGGGKGGRKPRSLGQKMPTSCWALPQVLDPSSCSSTGPFWGNLSYFIPFLLFAHLKGREEGRGVFPGRCCRRVYLGFCFVFCSLPPQAEVSLTPGPCSGARLLPVPEINLGAWLWHPLGTGLERCRSWPYARGMGPGFTQGAGPPPCPKLIGVQLPPPAWNSVGFYSRCGQLGGSPAPPTRPHPTSETCLAAPRRRFH